MDILGLAASQGQVYGHEDRDKPLVHWSPEDGFSFVRPAALYTAVSGNLQLIAAGQIANADQLKKHGDQHPRTAIGRGQDGRIGFVVVDGRQPGYSIGVNLERFATLLLSLGFVEAINLDGGGSATMVAGDGHGNVRLLSRPINHRIPKRERYVANHVGIRFSN